MSIDIKYLHGNLSEWKVPYLGICGLHTCEGRVAQFVRNHGITAPKTWVLFYTIFNAEAYLAPLINLIGEEK